MTPGDEVTSSALYRIEQTLRGARLVPVTDPVVATHVGIGSVRQMADVHARALEHLQAELTALRQQVAECAAQRDAAVHQAEQAETCAAARGEAAEQAADAVRRLLAKNAELAGEKRRLRDALIGAHPLPAIHERIDIDRDGVARLGLVVTLDTLPQQDHIHAALAEARRAAAHHNGELRTLRLDTVTWRAVIQRVIAR